MSHASRRLRRVGLAAALALVVAPAAAQAESFPPSKVVFDPPTLNLCGTPPSVTLRWIPATDSDGTVVHYLVSVNDAAPVQVVGTSYTVPNLVGDVTVTISAVDNQGLAGVPTTATFSVPVVNCPPPGKPRLSVGETSMTTIALSWTPVIDEFRTVKAYNVYRNGSRVATVSAPLYTYVDRGLTRLTSYRYAVEAVYDDNAVGPKSDEVSATTQGEGQDRWLYAVKGSTTLKTLASGKVSLTGGLVLEPNLALGTATADLYLANASGRLLAAGFLPVTAKLAFVPSGLATGTIEATSETASALTLNAKVRIKVLDAKLFGSIPLVAGNTCQTKQLTDLTLKSTNGFGLGSGGTIAGTYAMSMLNGCGGLNGIVSPLTAGGGNTITLALTAQP